MFWNKPKELLPENSGRTATEDTHAQCYVVYAVVRFVSNNQTEVFEAKRISRLGGLWHWEIDRVAYDSYEVVSWAWPPANYCWMRSEEMLPEESGRVSSKPLGSMFYQVLTTIRLVPDGRLMVMPALRIRRFDTNIEALDELNRRLLGEDFSPHWHWEVEHMARNSYEVISWMWLPDENDPRWIRDTMPEEYGLTRDVLGLEIATVLALSGNKECPTSAPEVKFRNRFCVKGEKWEWSFAELYDVLAWMPRPAPDSVDKSV